MNVHYELACFLGDAYAASILMANEVRSFIPRWYVYVFGNWWAYQVLLDLMGSNAKRSLLLRCWGGMPSLGSHRSFFSEGGTQGLELLTLFYGWTDKVPGQLLEYDGRP